jgi:hypothetical protein
MIIQTDAKLAQQKIGPKILSECNPVVFVADQLEDIMPGQIPPHNATQIDGTMTPWI